MKTHILKFFALCSLMLLSSIAFGQVPTIAYTPTTNNYTINTAITAFAPSTSTGVTGSFAATTTFTTVANATFGVVVYDNVAGYFYAVSKGNIYQINATTGAVVNTYNPTQLNNANSGTGIITDPTSGNIYVSDNNNNTVVEFTSGGVWVRTITGFSNPNELALDAAGNLYVADSGTADIYEISPTGTTAGTAILTGLTGVYGIAINSAGDLYGTQNGGSNATRLIFKVANITSTPRTKTTFVPGNSGFTAPRGLTVDAFGDLFLADGAAIKMISPTGTVTTITAITGLGTPGQVDFDNSGNMYIADGGTTIKKSVVTYYALTGTIPPGLTFNYTTGTFTGTPTTLGTYNVSVTAKNVNGTSTAVALTFNINAHPPILAFTPNAYTFVNGTAITAFSVVNTGDPIVGNYSITGGTLPSGLIFTASTGTISGTPNAVTAGAVAITVSGTNTGGTAMATVNITVNNPPPPIISYTNNDVYVNGTTITPNLSPTSTGGPVASYAAPTLPAGLSIDPVTGIISGTPSAASPATGYTVTATNPGGTGTFIITITVNNPPVPNFTYTNPPAITYGSAIAAVTPTNSGNPATSCTISPTGTGIVVSATGVVSGTPTAAGTQIYTITPSNAGGAGPAATVTITVNQKALTVTAKTQTKNYGTTFTFAGTEFTTAGLIGSDNVTGATITSTGSAATATVAGSPYPIAISAATGTGLTNYNITYVNSTMAVTKVTLTVTAKTQTKNYGTTFTFAGTEFTTTGLLNTDNVTGATITSTGSAATATVAGSPYPIAISAATGTGLTNYNITYVNSTMAVSKVTLTVTANNISKTYGSTYTFAGTEFTTSGLLNTDKVNTATITSTGAVATATVAGSPYPILISAAVGTGLTNYNITYVSGAMTVTPAAVTITANSQTRDVGIVTTLTVTYTGLQNGATTTTTLPTISTTATVTSPVGTYPITATGAADPNYTITYVAGVLTITASGTHTYTWDWTGAISTTWETPGNWDIGGVPQTTNYPGSATNKDIADIGVNILYPSAQSPVITGATVSIASITFGTDNAVNVGLTVNGTLTTSVGITLQVDNNIFGNALNINLSGSGTINVPSLNVINNETALAFETSSINSSVANLNVTGNITLTTTAFILANIGSKFTVTGGTTTVGGVLTTVNSPGFLAATTSTFSVYPTTTATLNLTNANAMNLDNNTSVIDFDHAGSTVNYTGTAALQTVYTTPTTNATGGVPYRNLTISGTGTGVPAAGTLTVDQNMVTSGTTNFATNAPTATIAGTWTNTANVTQGAAIIAVNTQLINTSNTITGGTGTLTAASMEFNGGTLIAGAGTVTSTGTYQNDSGTFNCGTAANANVIFGGNYTNNGGVFIANPTSTSKVTFSGSAPALVDKTTAGTTFNNVNFNTTNAAISNNTGNFAVAATGTLTMGANAKLTAGSANVGGAGYLTLLSTSSSTASVAAVPSTSIIIGAVNVQRFITGGSGTRGYRLLTSPTNISLNYSGGGNLGLSYLNTNASFGGTTYLGAFTEGPGTGFTYNGSYNPIIYLYDESRNTNNSGFTAGKNIGIYTINSNNTVYTLTSGVVSSSPYSIPVGNSYLFYYVGDNHDATQGAVVATRQPESISITNTGYLNQQNVPVKFWNTSSTNIPYDVTTGTSYPGLNQVGNPYPSTIDLNVVATDNTAVNKVFWELVPGGSYVSYSTATGHPVSDSRASNYIVSGQGFLVEAQATGETLTFQEHEKVAYPTLVSPYNSTTSQALLLSIPSRPGLNTNDVASLNADAPLNATTTIPQADVVSQTTPALSGLHMQLTKDSLNYVQTGIYFNNNNSSDKYVVNEDATSVNGSALVYLSSYSSDNVNLGINQLGDYSKGKRVRLYAGVSSSGPYTLSLADIANIDTVNYRVYLIDNKMNDSLDMVHYKSYAFTINNSDTTTYGANRFVLAIERIAMPPYKLISFTGQKVNNGVMLTWQTLNEGTYTVFALQKLVGNSYYTLSTIQGTGAGDYGYVDTHPVNGNNTYRLQQTDINGNITYTEPITINYNSKAPNGNLTIYPNPAKSMITISLSTNSTASSYVADIYNTSGTVISHKIVNADTWTQDISSYKLGVYIIEIKSNNGDLVGKSKFVKIF